MNQTTARPSTDTHNGFWLGSDITGSTVFNNETEELGTINELIVDRTKGNVRFAVVDVGGFLGLGETDVLFLGRPLSGSQRTTVTV